MGNLLLFVVYLYTFLFQPHLKKTIDSIFMHSILANLLTITFTLLPFIMLFLGVQYFLDDIGCKAVVFAYRVTQGLCISTASLLSTFQAITISPSSSKWAWLKSKCSKWILPSIFFFWIINMLFYIPIIQSTPQESHSLSSQPPAEHKATHSILLLVGCFVFFYCSNNFMTLYSFHRAEKVPVLEGISGVLSSCYPTISPYLLMKNSKIIQIIFSLPMMRINCCQRVFSN
ncbi:LOW QUALITY PROTEIN: vomeronasal type-1 receptor 4-like [Ctenodactylus gundi]